MKKLKEIHLQLKAHVPDDATERNNVLWQLICYSPKMPLRLHQQELLNEAEAFSLVVRDEYFAEKDLTFNGFKWGNGKNKILITHGWASKAADLGDIITALRTLDDVTVLAFDAPGNGSSEGELSNLLLYMGAVKAVIANYGNPDVLIGHSLGGMANAIALQDMEVTPRLLISITPLVRLKENFQATINSVGLPVWAQDEFLDRFEAKYHIAASDFNLYDQYPAGKVLKHWLAYDAYDQISPYAYMKEFLDQYPSIQNQNYDNVGHDRILKSPELINDILVQVKEVV